MAELGNDQALGATFAFGTVAVAAVAAATLILKGGVSTLFRDALRLVLLGYLSTSFLWALVGFIATFVKRSTFSGCQTAVAFAAVFDQLARILLEEFLFWSLKSKIQASLGVLLPQVFFLARFVLAGVFVGLQRPQFKPVCVGTIPVVPVAVVLLLADAAIIAMLLVRAYSVGVFTDMRDKTPAWPRSRSLLFITLALVVWTALSIPMILGLESIDLAVRTVLPAIGSLLVIALVAILRGNIKSSLQDTSRKPQITEASARDFPPLTGPPATRNQQSREASPPYSASPFISPARDAPSSSDSERSFTSREALPIISRPNPGQADAGVGGVLVTGQLFPPIKAQAAPGPAAKSSNERPIKKVTLNGASVTISNPVLIDDDEERERRVPTVDLATAARIQKEQRDMAPPPPPLSALDGPAKASSPTEIRIQPQVLKRKEVGMSADSIINDTRSIIDDTRQMLQLAKEPLTKGETTSAQLSPSADNMRRRSPTRQEPQFPIPSFPSVPTQKGDGSPNVGISAISSVPAEPQLPQEFERQSQTAENVSRRRKSTVMTSRRQSRIGAPAPMASNLSSKMIGQTPTATELLDVLMLPVPPMGSRGNPESPKQSTAAHDSTRETLASLSRNGPVRTDIRPSRQKLNSPPSEAPPEYSKIPLDVRQKSGIPSNPKARIHKPASTDQAVSQSAVRSDQGPENEYPGAAQGIMDPALRSTLETSPRVQSQESASIVNRPRPVPRKNAVGYMSPSRVTLKPVQFISNRALETTEVEEPKGAAEQTPSKNSDSPPDAREEERDLKQTPPPVLDVSAVAPPALSTLKDEGMEPSSRNETSAPARSPEGPVYDFDPYLSTENFDHDSALEMAFAAFDEQQTRPYASSLATSQPLNSPGDDGDRKRQSSPVIPADVEQILLASQHWDVDEGSGRIRSSKAAAKSEAAQSQPTNPIAETRLQLEPSDRRFTVQSALLTDDEDEGKETMTVMLDLPAEPQTSPDKREPTGNEPSRDSWHHRVGDKCPTFSDRKRMTRTRLVPRPPPLPLHEPTKLRKDVAAELPPLETPSQALEKIQEQLDKLGELVEQPAAEDGLQQTGLPLTQESHQRGMSLLADLEMEMGVQEDHWQEMRRDYSRASMSSIASSNDAGVSSAKLENMLLAAAGVESTGPDAAAMDLGNMGDPFSSPSDLEKWALGGDENLVSIRASSIDPERPTTSTSRPTSSAGLHSQVNISMKNLGDRSTDIATPSPSREDLSRPVTRKSLEPRGSDTSSPLEESRRAERPRTMRPPRRSKRMSSLPDILEDPVPMAGQQGNLGLFQFPGGERSDSVYIPLSSQLKAAMDVSMGMGVHVDMAPGMPPVFPTLDEQVRTLHSQDYPSSVFDDYDDDDDDDDDEETAGDEDAPSSDDDEHGQDEDEDEDDDDDSFDETTLWEIANLLKSDKVPSRGSLFPEPERGTRLESSSTASQNQAHVSTTESRNSELPIQSPSVPSKGESSSGQSTQARLWGGKISHATAMTSIGLPQPDKNWETYLIRAPEIVRAPLRVSQPASLASNSLWPPAREEPVLLSPGPSVSLWQSTGMLLDSRVTGLVNATGQKEQETAILDATLRPQQLKLAEPVYASLASPEHALAGSVHAPECVPVHITSRQASLTSVGSEAFQPPYSSAAVRVDGGAVMETGSGAICTLWIPPVVVPADEPRGLFQAHQFCDEKGQSSAEPAALSMRPTPRSSPPSLESLDSTSLWSRPSKHCFAYDWILLSSMRPSTSHTASSSWGSRSLFTETSSTRSSITGLSVTSDSVFAGCLDDADSSSSSQSVSGDDEVATEEQAPPSCPAKPTSQAELEAALAETLDPSSSSPVLALSSAVDEAAAEDGSSSPHGCSDASTVHPVFLTADVDTSYGEVHPAALGY